MASQTEQSKAFLRRITEEVWNDGNLSVIDELISEDLVDHIEPSATDGPGRARYRAAVTALRTAFPDYHEQIVWLVGEDDCAVSYIRANGTHNGPLHGIEPTGRVVEFNAMGALRFASGRVVERWGFGDSLGMMQQLGLM